jgi:hypothetical protein
VPDRESFLLNENVDPDSKLETIDEVREKLRESQEENTRLRNNQELLGKRLDAAEAWIRKEGNEKLLNDADFRTFKLFVWTDLQPFINKVALQNGMEAPKFPHFLNVGLRPEEPVPRKNDPSAGASGVKGTQHSLIRPHQ